MMDVQKKGKYFVRYKTGPKESSTIYLCNNNTNIRELKEPLSQKGKKKEQKEASSSNKKRRKLESTKIQELSTDDIMVNWSSSN